LKHIAFTDDFITSLLCVKVTYKPILVLEGGNCICLIWRPSPYRAVNTICLDNLCSGTVHTDIIGVFYLPTDVQYSCFKKNIKIYIKTAPTCIGSITIIRKHIIWAC